MDRSGGGCEPGDHRAARAGHDGRRVPKTRLFETWTPNSRFSRARDANESDVFGAADVSAASREKRDSKPIGRLNSGLLFLVVPPIPNGVFHRVENLLWVFIGFEELSYEIPESVHVGGLGHLSRGFHTPILSDLCQNWPGQARQGGHSERSGSRQLAAEVSPEIIARAAVMTAGAYHKHQTDGYGSPGSDDRPDVRRPPQGATQPVATERRRGGPLL
jgi:hypothetical protein